MSSMNRGFASDLWRGKIFRYRHASAPAFALPPPYWLPPCRACATRAKETSKRGLPNFGQHIDILRGFGVPVVVAINRFPKDTPAELDRLAAYCKERGGISALSEAFIKGGAGAAELAERVVEAIAAHPNGEPQPIYSLESSWKKKIQTVARKNLWRGWGEFQR